MDAHQRRLQRADPGDRAARARVLQDRLRRGELTPERVSLLAYLGDHAARELAPQAPEAPETLEAWVEGLREWGRLPLVRALAAAARATLPAAEAERRPCQTCGNYGQVQVRVDQTFDWEPCPSCGSCAICHGERAIGDPSLPCPQCVDPTARRLVEALEAWVEAGAEQILAERILARQPTLLVQHTFEDPSRPALLATCRACLDLSLSSAARPRQGNLILLGAAVAGHVAALDRAATPRGCVGDAIVDALHAWASQTVDPASGDWVV